MNKKTGGWLICSMLLIYVATLVFTTVTKAGNQLAPSGDEKKLEVSQVTLIDGGGERPLLLPAYIDVEGEVTLRATLDYSFAGHTAPTLMLQANHTFMTFLLDGEELYRVEPRDHSLGNYFAHIPLPAQAENATLEIKISVPENGQKRVQIPAITIAAEGQFIKELVGDCLPSLVLNAMILFCGMLMLLLALLDRRHSDAPRMLLRGILALNCALYFMCETACVVYLVEASRFVYYLDMLSFALLGPPLLILMGTEMSGWRKRLLNVLAGLGVVNAAGQAVLAFSGVAELRQMLSITHITQIVSILAMAVCLISCLVRKEKNRVLYTGLIIVVGGAVDMVLFLTERNTTNVFFLKIALLIYFLQQLVQFVHLLMEQSAERAREVYYKALALQDPMTRCYSRAAFEIDKQEWKGESVRTVFFLDLNNLKEVNDQYGHQEGDQLIRAFGEILSQVFQSVGKCYRVGGDEFWIFCDGLEPMRSAAMVQAAEEATGAYNQKNSAAAPLRYAVGLADTGETKGDLEEALRLADQRMYRDKRAEKEGR